MKAVTRYTLLSDVIKSFCFAKQNIIWGYFLFLLCCKIIFILNLTNQQIHLF